MTDMDTIQIVQRQESAPENYHAVDYKIDPNTYISPYGNIFRSDQEAFAQDVYECELALDLGQQPKLSVKGTSGCYFVFSRTGVSLCFYNFYAPTTLGQVELP